MTLLRVIFALVVNLGLAFSAENSEYPDCGLRTLQTYDLLGPVKSVRVEESHAEGRRELTAIYAFDRAGRLLEDRGKTRAGESLDQAGYQVFASSMNREGAITRSTCLVSIPRTEKRLSTRSVTLSNSTRGGDVLKSAILTAMANSTVRTFYKYDSRGDLIRETEYDSDGKIFSRQVRTYRPDHKLLSERAMGNPGKTMAHQWSREYQYDARGNQTDMLLYQQGVLEAHWKSTYDERNRRIAVQTIVADTKKDQQVNGKCSDCGLSSGVTIYKYDDAGQVIEERRFQLGDKRVSVEGIFMTPIGTAYLRQRALICTTLTVTGFKKRRRALQLLTSVTG